VENVSYVLKTDSIQLLKVNDLIEDVFFSSEIFILEDFLIDITVKV